MNHLNSVLIEGDTDAAPTMSATAKGTKFCMFEVKSRRTYLIDNEKSDEVSAFLIQAWGRLAEECALHVLPGGGVRAAGRLKHDHNYGLIIVA